MKGAICLAKHNYVNFLTRKNVSDYLDNILETSTGFFYQLRGIDAQESG